MLLILETYIYRKLSLSEALLISLSGPSSRVAASGWVGAVVDCSEARRNFGIPNGIGDAAAQLSKTLKLTEL